jgi:5-methylthioadenosine/S-adenosylhomocysteine deaminase
MTIVAPLRYRSKYLLTSAVAEVVEGGCVVVEGGKIAYVGPFGASADSGPFQETIDLGDAVVFPGFVNTHCHSAMSILRGVGNGLSLDDWLRKKVWPLEDHFREDEMVTGNLLSLIEYARSGITSFIDFYNVRPLLKALSKISMRCTLSLAFIDLVPAMKEESWRRLGLVGRYRREVEDGDGMRSLALAVHSSYACSEEMLKGVADAASTEGLMITGHLLEAPTEAAMVKATTGASPVTLLGRTGIIGPRFLAAHCVHLDRRGIGRLSKAKSSVAHCPRSNSRLGVGIAPVNEMMKEGLNVALGTDGVGSSDSVDFFEEMRTAAYLQRSANSDATLLRPRELLAMATSNGALALGNAGIGRLEQGRLADFAAVKLDRAHLNPLLDLVGNLVFCARPEDVCLTVSGGNVLQADGKVTGIDACSIVKKAGEIASGLG